MKDFSKFEAFKLNKVQMNAIAGGVVCYIHSGDLDIPITSIPEDMDRDTAADILAETYSWADSITCAG